MRILERFKAWAKTLKREVITLWYAYRHSNTPWYAKLWVALVVGYAFSPIDLIPDFIPVIGLLDDLLLVPVGVWVALKLIPPHVLADSRDRAHDWLAGKRERPRNLAAAAIVVIIWFIALGAAGTWAWRAFAPPMTRGD